MSAAVTFRVRRSAKPVYFSRVSTLECRGSASPKKSASAKQVIPITTNFSSLYTLLCLIDGFILQIATLIHSRSCTLTQEALREASGASPTAGSSSSLRCCGSACVCHRAVEQQQRPCRASCKCWRALTGDASSTSASESSSCSALVAAHRAELSSPVPPTEPRAHRCDRSLGLRCACVAAAAAAQPIESSGDVPADACAPSSPKTEMRETGAAAAAASEDPPSGGGGGLTDSDLNGEFFLRDTSRPSRYDEAEDFLDEGGFAVAACGEPTSANRLVLSNNSPETF